MTQADVANDLAILVSETLLNHTIIGRAAYVTEPDGAAAGVSLAIASALTSGTPRCRIYVEQWVAELGRSAVLTVAGFSAADTYTVTIDGTAYASATPANEAALWTALESAVNANADRVVDAVATASNLTLTYKADSTNPHAGWSLGIATSGPGGSSLEAIAEPVSMAYKVQGYNGTYGSGTALTGWADLLDECGEIADNLIDHQKGGAQSWPTPGMQRLAIWVYELGGAYEDSGTITLTPYRIAIGASTST